MSLRKRPPPAEAETPLDPGGYFCYISRSKIDQLMAALAPQVGQEWKQTESIERNAGATVEGGLSLAHVLTVFKGGATYGRKGVLQREQQVKLTYVDKLRTVLVAIAEQGPIPPFDPGAEPASGGYFVHRGRFRVAEPIAREARPAVGDVVTLRSGDLLLDCSLRFFSEGPEADGSFLLHSGNTRFFRGQIDLDMVTVFLLLGRQDGQVVGTPLFLQLGVASGAAL